jgi:hypothetical protein
MGSTTIYGSFVRNFRFLTIWELKQESTSPLLESAVTSYHDGNGKLLNTNPERESVNRTLVIKK